MLLVHGLLFLKLLQNIAANIVGNVAGEKIGGMVNNTLNKNNNEVPIKGQQDKQDIKFEKDKICYGNDLADNPLSNMTTIQSPNMDEYNNIVAHGRFAEAKQILFNRAAKYLSSNNTNDLQKTSVNCSIQRNENEQTIMQREIKRPNENVTIKAKSTAALVNSVLTKDVAPFVSSLDTSIAESRTILEMMPLQNYDTKLNNVLDPVRSDIYTNFIDEVKDPKTVVLSTLDYLGHQVEHQNLIEKYTNNKLLAKNGLKRVSDIIEEFGTSEIRKGIFNEYSSLRNKFWIFSAGSKLAKIGGSTVLPIEIGLGVKEIYNAAESERIKTTYQVTSGLFFGSAGALLGAKFGLPGIWLLSSAGNSVGSRLGEVFYDYTHSNEEDSVNRSTYNIGR